MSGESQCCVLLAKYCPLQSHFGFIFLKLYETYRYIEKKYMFVFLLLPSEQTNVFLSLTLLLPTVLLSVFFFCYVLFYNLVAEQPCDSFLSAICLQLHKLLTDLPDDMLEDSRDCSSPELECSPCSNKTTGSRLVTHAAVNTLLPHIRSLGVV